MRFKGDILLLIAAIIWGSAFVAQRIGAEHVGVFLFNGSRFLLGAVLLALLLIIRREKPDFSNLKTLYIPGIILYVASALQQAGMAYTSAGNAGFITGLYVILVPVMAAIILKTKVRLQVWLGAVLAVSGMYLLSVNGNLQIEKGDALIMGSAVFWALHVLVIGRYAVRVPAIQLATGQFFICGILNVFSGLVIGGQSLPGFAQALYPILYTGIFSTAIAFTLQVAGQRLTQASDAAIIMSLEAAFAALFGFLILNEILNTRQIIGVTLMFAGMLLSQIRFTKFFKHTF